MDVQGKLNRYMRKARQKSTANPVQHKLDQVQQMLNSDAVDTLLDNGDLTPKSLVTTLRTIVDAAADTPLGALSRHERNRMMDCFDSSTRRRPEDLNHFRPYGAAEVTAAIEEIRILQSTVTDFESAMTFARRSASTVIDNSHALAAHLIYQLETGVTPND